MVAEHVTCHFGLACPGASARARRHVVESGADTVVGWGEMVEIGDHSRVIVTAMVQ